MESSFTFLRIRGIPVGANWSWLVVFALIAWSLGSAFFPRTYPGLDGSVYLAMGLATAILFFLSILLHELGHAFRALKEGMQIEGITLWLFGGVARFKGMFPTPGAEFRIAIAGPAVSVALAAAFAALAWGGERAGAPDAIRGVVDYLARINVILVGFNLVPALPLDGGRVLRAWLWHRQRSFAAATISAARAGRAFGGVLIGIGLLGLFTGAGTGGIWFAFIGWFLLQAAQSEAAYAVARRALGTLRVADLMTSSPIVVDPSLTIAGFLDDVARMYGHSTYPVVELGRVVGLMNIRMAGTVAASERDTVRVRDVMLAGDDVPTLDPSVPAVEALQVLASGPARAVVVHDGRLVGLISISDVARALEIEQVRGPAPEPQARPAGAVVWIVVVIAMALAAGLLYHPPVAVISPGEALDVTRDIRIDGTPVERPTAKYLLTSVRLEQPTGLGLALAMVRPDREVVSLGAVVPRGVDPDRFLTEQQDVFRESQMTAAAAAARAVGLDVAITGTGARVVGVLDGAPAAKVLRPDDVIVEISGTPVRLVADVRSVLQAHPAGTRFDVTIERGSSRRTVRVPSARLPVAEVTVGIGVQIETRDLDVELPFRVRFREREIGGPSAGLAYALAIADLLEPGDPAPGRTIAATGTITLDGTVGRVGGVGEKAVAAKRRGADVFLVPAGEVDEARLEGLAVVGVQTLEDALTVVRGTA